MTPNERPDHLPAFDPHEGMSLTLAYLADPSNVPCPRCGPGHIEVIGYVENGSLAAGAPRSASPDRDYTVVLICHGCRSGAALELERDHPDRRHAA
jgi:hypothetical protein